MTLIRKTTLTTKRGWTDLYPWTIDRASDVPLFRQVYRQLRDTVTKGVLKPGSKLPSTRDLSLRLGVARMVVVTAFEQLMAESVIVGRRGSGSYVSSDLPPDVAFARAPGQRSRAGPQSMPVTLRDGFREHTALHDDRPFATGRTLLDPRSAAVWRKLTQRAVRALGPVDLGYADPRGSAELRHAVSAYLESARGVNADPDQIIITSGTQQAIDLAIRVVLKRDDEAWVENPGYSLTAQALTAAGVILRPVAVDQHGIDVAAGVRAAAKARAAFVTPSHQFPTGVVMSMARRMELLAWAKSAGAWIIEDDYASEFRYSGKPLSSLQGLDTSGRVIYVGTLNKVLFPGLRLGYLVAPAGLTEAMIEARYLMDRQPASLTQAMVTAFMTEGHVITHLRRTRTAYAAQRDALAAALKRHGGDFFDVAVPDQGLHLVAYLKRHRSDIQFEALARSKGVIVRAMSRLYLAGRPRQALMLGFSGFPVETIGPAAAKLAKIASMKL